MSEPLTCAWIGLGAMGAPLAAHLGPTTRVWNRTAAVATDHAAKHGQIACASLADTAAADVIFLCLPTSAVVASVVAELTPHLHLRGQVLVDCTSGDPAQTRAIAESLPDTATLLDCPVSGGPRGAAAGTVTAMVGGDAAAYARVRPLLRKFAKTIKHVGRSVGAAHAVKAMNNALNATHLLAAAEALAALTNFGVAPGAALACINASSGQSLQTRVRIPAEVLPRKFAYGFKLGLMRKDVRIADGLMRGYGGGGDGGGGEAAASYFFQHTLATLDAGVEALGADADYTESVKLVEARAGCELRVGGAGTGDEREESGGVGGGGGGAGDRPTAVVAATAPPAAP